jgi:mRNA interferase MazF
MCEYGDVYYARLLEKQNSRVQQGLRPVLIVSNNKANCYSPIITVIPLTTSETKRNLPTHVTISGYGLNEKSIALVEQITAFDKINLIEKVCSLARTSKMNEINRAIGIQLALNAS